MRLAAAGLLLALTLPAAAQTITDARLQDPTDRYDHAILGDGLEWGAVQITGPEGSFVLRLPETRVFEDVDARIVRLAEGKDAVLLVETDLRRGASVALYDAYGRKIAATPFIGQPHRWYAPIGAADFDGDGEVEIVYVDRPHLQKELVFARIKGDQLETFARFPGLTNHRIGDHKISAGIRDCGQGPEVLLPDADWRRLMAATPAGVGDLARYDPEALSKALRCR